MGFVEDDCEEVLCFFISSLFFSFFLEIFSENFSSFSLVAIRIRNLGFGDYEFLLPG